MSKGRPCALSIAGFDPSGGAGILADIKTMEAHKVICLGVVTGLTFQNDSEFIGVNWTSPDDIIKQITVLNRKFYYDFVKIGMIQNLDTLQIIIKEILSSNPKAKVIWDPIIKASAGYEIHNSVNKEKLVDICGNIFLLTPNIDEIKVLDGNDDVSVAAKELSQHCNVFLKGGHSEKKKARDYLFTKSGTIFPFRPKQISDFPKHGSGCVLSAAITANLTKGSNLQRACLKAKDYVTKLLASNKTLLGYHKI